MCGILGVVNFGDAGELNAVRFEAGLAKLDHRGPDGRRVLRVGDQALFGHARLAIIDLTDDSNQPFVAGDRYTLIFNGEIFNYIELRRDLAAEGVEFHTEGDTEVLLQAWLQWGDACVHRFNGMWAFAIHDRRTGRLFASRDRFGIKPFNYAVVDGQLIFASEIKAILEYAPALIEPDYNVIANFCRTSVGAQHPQTWFKRVRRLQPGHNLWLDGSRIRIARYWDYPQTRRHDVSFDDAAKQYRALFEDAVRIRMRSDVPLGVTLSSGVDSNSIVHAMQAIEPRPYHCLTSRFTPAEGLTQDGSIFVDGSATIDEATTAVRVAKDLALISELVETDYSDIVNSLTRIVRHLESGNSAPAVIPLMQLLRRARQHMTVVLDGQGADELLGGYITSVFWAAQADLVRRGKITAFWESLRQFRRTYTLKSSVLMALRQASNAWPWLSALHQRLTGLSAIYGPKLRGYRRVADWPEAPSRSGEGPLDTVLRQQHSGGLVNLLHYGDAISMANSLEARMPFLDHRLVEYVWPLPAEYKVRLGLGKVLHREAMRGLVPDYILDERNKHGFTTPISKQFRKEFGSGDGPVDVLLSDRCLNRGLFDRAGLTRVIDAHRSGRADHGPLLFRLLATELWFREFVDPAAEAEHPEAERRTGQRRSGVSAEDKPVLVSAA